MKVGVYLDISNLYYTVKKHSGEKIDYSKYLEFVADFGDIVIKKAFLGVREDKISSNFQKALTGLGFELYTKKLKVYRKEVEGEVVVSKKCDMDVDIAVSLIEDLKSFDRVVVGCADADMIPVYNYLQARDKEIIVLAKQISNEVSTNYQSFEIPPSLLLRKK